jgi:hypothetical protein
MPLTTSTDSTLRCLLTGIADTSGVIRTRRLDTTQNFDETLMIKPLTTPDGAKQKRKLVLSPDFNSPMRTLIPAIMMG